MHATIDRADIIHFAGHHRLSPALREGSPALVAQGEPGDRCGWERFFGALRERGLAAVFDPDEPSSLRFAPRGGAAQHERLHRRGRRGAGAELRRFLDALRGRYTP